MKLAVRDRERDKEIERLRGEGMTYGQIGGMFGITKTRARQLYNRIAKENRKRKRAA
jgi:DNA-binding CsgD family transcriptional regulator